MDNNTFEIIYFIKNSIHSNNKKMFGFITSCSREVDRMLWELIFIGFSGNRYTLVESVMVFEKLSRGQISPHDVSLSLLLTCRMLWNIHYYRGRRTPLRVSGVRDGPRCDPITRPKEHPKF